MRSRRSRVWHRGDGRKWVVRAVVDAGQRPGTTTDESAELRRLRRENAELRRATKS